jgi:hypothetical protein
MGSTVTGHFVDSFEGEREILMPTASERSNACRSSWIHFVFSSNSGH